MGTIRLAEERGQLHFIQAHPAAAVPRFSFGCCVLRGRQRAGSSGDQASVPVAACAIESKQ
jgi:hypothetical protein